MNRLYIGATMIEIYDDDLTVTVLADGSRIPARPQDNDTYRARARSLGYGDRTMKMSRDHEILHALLAHVLGLPESPTMRGIASGEWRRCWPSRLLR